MKLRYTSFFIAAAVIILIIGLVWFNYFIKNDQTAQNLGQPANQQASSAFYAEAALPVAAVYQKDIAGLQNEFLNTLQQPLQPADVQVVESFRQKLLQLHAPLSAQTYHFKLVVAADLLKQELGQVKVSAEAVKKQQSNLLSLLSTVPSF